MLLRKFEGNFSRERFLDMDEWEMTNVLARPDFHDGNLEKGYWPVGRMADPKDPPVKGIGKKGIFYHPDRVKAMKVLGYTDADIDAKYDEWSRKFYDGAQQHGR